MNCSFKSLLVALILLCSTVATAHDFEVGGIFYNITSSTEKTVEVTYKGDSYDAYSNEYTDYVTVPSTVAYNGNTYSVTSIGEYAFYYCDCLTSIEIPGSVTSIGNYAFEYCSGLKSVTIGDGVTSIGEYAFSDCSGLTSVTIGDGVTSIGEYAFNLCSGLKSIVVTEENTVYDSRNNCNAIIETATNTLIQGCQNTIIPSSVTSIGDGAFRDCNSLTSIEIPGSVTNIGGWAFSGCDGLTSIEIPGSATSIGEYAFYRCFGLTSIEIPGSVTSIGEYAFGWCSGLTSIVVDGNNRHYDSREGCNAIIETATNALIKGCKNTTIPGSVTSIGNEAFDYCSDLTSIEIPGSVTSIGESAFSGCSGLTSIEIPGSVTSIGEYAFNLCYGLTSIEIPGSVTNIGEYAFSNCYRLKSVTSLATTAPGLGSEAFYGISSDATLYYPAGSDYSSWEQYFANIEEITEEFPEEEEVFGDLNGDGTVSVSDIQVLVNLILSDAAAEDNPAADVNSDGTVSVSDIQVVVNRILGKY